MSQRVFIYFHTLFIISQCTLLACVGIWIYSSQPFASLHQAQIYNEQVLVDQLDEQNTISAYALTRNPGLLQPYFDSKKTFDIDITLLKTNLSKNFWTDGTFDNDLRDIQALHDQWEATVVTKSIGQNEKVNPRALGRETIDDMRVKSSDVNYLVTAQVAKFRVYNRVAEIGACFATVFSLLFGLVLFKKFPEFYST